MGLCGDQESIYRKQVVAGIEAYPHSMMEVEIMVCGGGGSAAGPGQLRVHHEVPGGAGGTHETICDQVEQQHGHSPS